MGLAHLIEQEIERMARLEGGALPAYTGPRPYEVIAQAFHESYERQAPDWGYKTREASAVPWAEVPAANRELMMAVVADLLDRRIIRVGTHQGSGIVELPPDAGHDR